jgi:hypothetical protein
MIAREVAAPGTGRIFNPRNGRHCETKLCSRFFAKGRNSFRVEIAAAWRLLATLLVVAARYRPRSPARYAARAGSGLAPRPAPLARPRMRFNASPSAMSQDAQQSRKGGPPLIVPLA